MLRLFTIVLIFFLIFVNVLYAQRIPDPNVGDVTLKRTGTMDGNLVRTLFINWGEIAHWPDSPSGEWPKGTGHQYVDGVALVVQARAIDNNGIVIYPMETQYREFVDKGPEDELWGWAPVPGYFNSAGTEPAVSDDPLTWPSFWPDKPDGWINPNEIPNDLDDDENGLVDDLVYWNGFFGKGVRNADLEAYFVFDDDPDEEWDFYPDPADPDRRGMGLEVASRLFQWSQVLAEDVVFAVYFITNEGKYSYDSTYYAFYIDWGVGGTDDSSDDTGDYDTFLDIAWAWDLDGIGTPGMWSPVGVAGFAFLESPGIQDDGIDNDDDGLIDENRESGAGVWLSAYPYGVDDPAKFFTYFGREPSAHWSGDEDDDWMSYSDVNGNGMWDEGEALNDDVGEDGLDPTNFNYEGPDQGEGDGMPTSGEPNFDFTDKDESDQIGLTGFRIFPVHTYELWNEDQNWEVFKAAPPPHSAPVTANLGMFFSSGPFPLEPGQTENYSMGLLFGNDYDDLVLTKKTIQQIYNADYRFAQPPLKPKLKAVISGNKRVVLVWDDRAESSFDPFLQEFDFEGYTIYKSTEPDFLENRLITDAYGRLTYQKPIAKFDLKNDIQGLHPIDVLGANYNLGENSGLQHYFVDTDVKNGQTYYYAIVSFDHGLIDTSADGSLVGIPPAECTSKISKDISGNVKVDLNTAAVTPRAPAAGYVNAGLEGDFIRETIGTGEIQIDYLVPDSILDGHEYSIEFGDTSYYHNEGSSYYTIYDITDGQKISKTDTIWVDELSKSPLVDGFTLEINNDAVDFDPEHSDWIVGGTNYRPRLNLDKRFSAWDLNIFYPSDFEIMFSDQIIDTADNSRALYPPTYPTKFSVYDITEGKGADYMFVDYYVQDSALTPLYPWQNSDSTEAILIWVDDARPASARDYKTSWRFYFESDTTYEEFPPQPGDLLRISFTKPFRTGDRVTFTVQGAEYDNEKAKHDINDIAVVPNPYVVAASWEERSPFRFGRGERKLYFIHLPKKCTIRIYTIRGYLVDTINHDSTFDDGQASWNLLNKNDQEIAYGVYVYHVDAPEVGEKVGKFAVIK